MSPRARPPRLADLAADLVDYGRKRGADEIEVSVSEGREFEAGVRRGRIENLVEAGSRVMGLRVIKDGRTAFAGASDLEPRTLRRLVRGAVQRAALAEPDPHAGLAPLSPDRVDAAALDLYDPAVPALAPEIKIDLALRTEKAALADKRITNSYGASFVTHETSSVLANSNGFTGEFRRTYCSLSVGLQAGGTDDRVEDFWFSSKRRVSDLASPEEVARIAVERTVRQLRPRKISTRNVPVIFEPLQTAWLVGFLFGCVSGVSVYRGTSYLGGKLGERIGSDLVDVVDDGTLPRALGSRPFDSDGLPVRRTKVVEKGVLKSFLCNTYAARRLGLASTGNADGSGVGPNNFYLEKGSTAPEEIVRSTKRGFLLIRTLGHGLNTANGDISRGAFGLWIEDGKIAYPVSEVTISGNLDGVLRGIEQVGIDLEFTSSVVGPTIKVAEMTVAGR